MIILLRWRTASKNLQPYYPLPSFVENSASRHLADLTNESEIIIGENARSQSYS
jgi:hypothetical protein